jgi:hypothetical protein
VGSILRLLLIVLLPLTAQAQSFGGSNAGTCSALTISYGTVYKYNVGSSGAKTVNADGWYNTWADDNGNYVVGNDSLGWQQATSSNLQVSTLSTTDTTTTGTSVNTMASWGTFTQTGSDGLDFKTAGIISVAGTLIMGVNRATQNTPNSPPYQFNLINDNLIKSTDHGATWTPSPPMTAQPYVSPTFTTQMSNVDWVQYGKDYGGSGDSGSDTYVYAMSTEGPYNNADKVFLGRVTKANIANLSASDWSYWTGVDAHNQPTWTSTWSSAVPVMQEHFKQTASAGTQYFPSLGQNGCYIRINWWYPSVVTQSSLDPSSSTWVPYAAPHPWGPWSAIGSPQTWNSSGMLGLFGPHIMPKSVTATGGGATATILTTGDYNNQNAATGDYTLTMIPLTITTH